MEIYKLAEIKEKIIVSGSRVKFVHTKNMTVAYWTFEPDILLPEHSHPHEQISYIADGEFELNVNGKSHFLKSGDIAIIPPNAIHFGKSITNCKIIDTFYPVREDYR